MRAEIIAAERAGEVRAAAQGWRRAGFLSAAALSRALASYPDDRQRFGPGLRALAFIFTIVAAWALIGLWFVFFDHNPDHGGSFLMWAAAMAALTEWQRGPLRRADAGAESATALMSASLAIVGGTIAFGGGSFNDFLTRFLISAFVACAAAAWRWGDVPFFLGAGLAGFGLLAQAPFGRLLWIAASVLVVPFCLHRARAASLPPSYRRGCIILAAVGLVALYVSVHIWSVDQSAIESLRIAGRAGAAGVEPARARSWSILATGLLPPLLLVIGWRRREPLLLYGGLLLIGASIATIRIYREVMPLSIALILIGSACLALALAVRRWLRGGDKGERDGFTADPLFDNTNRTEAIRAAVAMASFTPEAQPTPSRPAFQGGGGGFGGGGAAGSF